ncbi:MAG: peptidoglycan DD-metalloendopeptidase family protein, partial [Tissierellia bacterium]|nr:peptidoglycan DD-metalloendopeptidase family protein [Tissierellia bacterium]
KRKVVQEEKMPYETEYAKVSYMYNDEEIVTRAGKYGISEIEAILTEQNGIQIAKEVLSEKVITEPVTKLVTTGTQDPPPKQGTGFFINPLPGSMITSRFGSRSGGFHLGQDMAKASGSSIKAADGGTVLFTGWSGSYGYMVDIDHGGGFTTRYAHCSDIYVSAGEKVYQGKIIAAVGSTGVSSGPHLHFEVRKYGSVVNPAAYIGIQYR